MLTLEAKTNTQQDNVVVSPERLAVAYKQLYEFVFGKENMERIIRLLKRHGAEPYEQLQQLERKATKLNAKSRDISIVPSSAATVDPLVFSRRHLFFKKKFRNARFQIDGSENTTDLLYCCYLLLDLHICTTSVYIIFRQENVRILSIFQVLRQLQSYIILICTLVRR
ncbi:hypothetical protein BDC45DRAFT_517543 [Circinella umbellata]|nr:hypothetical protein BDC45DRAFT_517543 [Circinella umbellata]